MNSYEASLDSARLQDSQDQLKDFRSEFHFPTLEPAKKCTYLCGNSLGLMPKNAKNYVQQELDHWAKYAVEGHFKGDHPWLPYHEFLTQDLAALVGAMPSEVVAMNSLTVNLHLMLISFYRPTLSRRKIVMGHTPFPSDRYAVKSQIKLRGFDPEEDLIFLEPRDGEDLIREEDVLNLLDKNAEQIALVLLEGVNYASGQALPLQSIIHKTHQIGALFGLDLAHTIGNLELALHDWDVDFAVWCSYKYLNGGPGCVAGAFVHQKNTHAEAEFPRLAGWWGHNKETRFKMGPEFSPIEGAEGWQLSNPPILPLASLRASLELFREARIENLRSKSVRLTGYLEYLIDIWCGDKVEIITPRNPTERGAQLSLRISGGRSAFDQLENQGVICDWREPNIVRVAPAPIYNSFEDVYNAAKILSEVCSK